MAVTIVDHAQSANNSGQETRAAVIISFARGSKLLAVMPTVDVAGNSFTYRRQASLATTAFRALNTAYTESSSKFDERTEVLKPCGGDLDVDTYHVSTNPTGDVKSIQVVSQAQSLGQLIGFKILKGNSGTDPLEFDGLQTRYGGLVPALGGVAGALDETTRILTNATGAGAALSMKILDQGLDAVDPTIGRKVIVGPQAMRRNIQAFLRGSGTAVQMERDAFGDPLMVYGGATWIDADQNGDLAGLAFDEGGNTTTSVYVLALGDTGVNLLQTPGGMQVTDFGHIAEKPVHRVRAEWPASLADMHKRCVCRIVNITNATAVA